MKRSATAVLMAALGAAVFFYARSLSAADTDFPIYFENSVLALKSQSVNRITYLPLAEIVSHLSLPYTDATALGSYTLRSANSQLVLIPNSAFISINDRPVLLQNPIRRDSGKWYVPLDFLSQGLSRITGIEFRYRPGTSRVFAGNVNPAELVMGAQALGPMTRLTLRLGTRIDVDLQRDAAQHRVVLVLKDKAIDPFRERLDYKDRMVQSVAFDDSDGVPKILVGTSDDVRDVRISAGEDNHVYFVDFIRETATTETAPPPLPAAPANAPKPDVVSDTAGLRVIVIDPGHGGIEPGTVGAGTMEKDLTLTIARKLRSALQSRLGATVLLTRDSDVALSSEARAAVANNNQAGLLISLHIGYSQTKLDSASIYVMQDGFGNNLSPVPSGDRLFLPWFLAHRSSKQGSGQVAKMLQEQLSQALPGWKFPLRAGPIGVLASATMPAVAIEIGNINNLVSAQTLTDATFQSKLASTIAAAVEQYAESRPAGRP